MPDQRFFVEKRAAESRFVLLDREAEPGDDNAGIGEESYLDVDFADRPHRIMYHTGVSEEYGGLGLAASLVRSAVEETISEGLAIVPVCPYVVRWLGKHPEYEEHVVKPTPEHMQALDRK